MSRAGAPLYHYRSEGQEEGPVSSDKLLELFETHMITAFDEVRREGETQWHPVQTVVTVILEQKKSGGRGRGAQEPSASTASKDAGTQGGARAPAREQNVLMAQRGAPTPKPAGSISDEDLAQSIAYANAEVKRGWMVRGAITFTLLAISMGLAIHYSATLHGTPALDTPWQVETQVVIEPATAQMTAPRGSWSGTGRFVATRVRDVTFGSDGTVSMLFRDESTRWQADLEGGPDHNELKPGVLRGQTVTFAPGDEGWRATLASGTPNPRQALKLEALAFDNGALYPERRMWPWPWQSWLVKGPQACSLLALDLESCEGELKVRFVGFADAGAERCARLTFEGKWAGRFEGDPVVLNMTGAVLRSTSRLVDVSIQGEGTMSVRRTIVGPTSTHEASLSGAVAYTQTTVPAP